MLCEQPARAAADDADETKRYRSVEQVRKALEEGWETEKQAIAAARQKKVVAEDEKKRLQAENEGLRAELGQERATRQNAEAALDAARLQIGNLETDLKAQTGALEVQNAQEIAALRADLRQERAARSDAELLNQRFKNDLHEKSENYSALLKEKQSLAVTLDSAEEKNRELLAQIAKLESGRASGKSIFARFWPLGYALAGLMLVFLLLRPGASPAPSPTAAPLPSLASTAVVSPSSTPLLLTSATVLPSPTTEPTATALPSPAPTLGIGSTWLRPADGMTMLYVPGGTFTMGSADISNATPHQVTLSPYWIDQTDVTNAEYAKCVAAGGCTEPSNKSSATRSSYYGNSQFDNYPVIYVNWNQAKSYCEWAGAKLPSEAQWELAARGMEGRTYPWAGNTIDKSYANFNQNVVDTTAVCSYPQGVSPYGACDMAGNVWQWTADWYVAYPGNTSSNPDFGNKYRVLRGGSWNNNETNVRSALRGWYVPALTNLSFGFRCALSK